MHKLSKAAGEINKDLERRAFHDATEKMHAFWLYDLCDVFIEATKPFTTDETPEDIKESVKNTIYTCLESALRLVHPVMPYVSEDLWQRLPRRPDDKSETIMLCSYPTEVSPYLTFQHVRVDLDSTCSERTTTILKLKRTLTLSLRPSGQRVRSWLATVWRRTERRRKTGTTVSSCISLYCALLTPVTRLVHSLHPGRR